MQIPIPRLLVRAWDQFVEWGDVPIWRLPLDVRRIDLLLAILFLLPVSYYGYIAGWRGAMTGGITFILIMLGASLFRK